MLNMFSYFYCLIFAFGASVVAQSSPTVVCVAGQCLQGYSNLTIGARLSAPGFPTSILLLPDQYTSTTNPQLLHNLLTSSSASIAPSPGFETSASSVSLPLNLAMQPGLAIFADRLYSGQAAFSELPSEPAGNASTPLSAGSLALASNVWASVSAGSNERIVLWDSVADVAQLPGGSNGGFALLDLQSSACSPPCAGAGVCSSSGTCSCPTGFAGSACETCAPGFFGSTCQPCPSDCATCDEGITGSGRCLASTASNSLATCNCLNGACGSNGQCACNSGWVTADNGTACAKCADGFFLTPTGDCQVCQLGCTKCSDGTGTCVACKSGFTQDANDRTKCTATKSVTSTGTVCPDGSFGDGTTCTACSPTCRTCTGGTSNDCVICAPGTFLLNGNCVAADANGVCEGTTLIADNNKHECDTCGAKCTSCRIPNFNPASTINQLQCTGCLPGYMLSEGKCVDSCPAGSSVSPQDNITCTRCDASCATCSGAPNFCLTCPGNQLAFNGKCVSSCPSNAFSSSGSCLSCHPDCASCSGGSFNQCSSCPPDRPVLNNGRCLSTCSKSQFFDKPTSSCVSCDSSCSSCSGAGPSRCLGCASSTQVLRAGTCVSASCTGSSNVIAGLGVCLSDLVAVPQTSGTSTPPPLPSITGLTNPTVISRTSSSRPLEWWQILLMALGCAFIFVVILMLWRRRARKQRAKQTAMFASAKQLEFKGNWRWRLVRFGEKLFGHSRSHRAHPETEEMKLMKLRAAEEARYERDMDKLLDSYDYERAGSSRSPVTRSEKRDMPRHLSANSLFSEVTGARRRGPDARQPVKTDHTSSRLSASTLGSYMYTSPPRDTHAPPVPALPTDAQTYADANRPVVASPPAQGAYWMQPVKTGSSTNPFRK
ncbi:hypothetical protein HGRIS_013755 [Hohenbuehelia grisea]|uniref:EGF-like domain-containing protein n=1 Tax=Hohenbuehelia grisea TaxID=104357 RepID=A0ABR3IWG6_9AGAR